MERMSSLVRKPSGSASPCGRSAPTRHGSRAGTSLHTAPRLRTRTRGRAVKVVPVHKACHAQAVMTIGGSGETGDPVPLEPAAPRRRRSRSKQDNLRRRPEGARAGRRLRRRHGEPVTGDRIPSLSGSGPQHAPRASAVTGSVQVRQSVRRSVGTLCTQSRLSGPRQSRVTRSPQSVSLPTSPGRPGVARAEQTFVAGQPDVLPASSNWRAPAAVVMPCTWTVATGPLRPARHDAEPGRGSNRSTAMRKYPCE